MKILLLFATELEARATRASLNNPNVHIAITGMGPATTFKAASKLIPHADFIINAGVCGSFNPLHEVSSCHQISTVSYLSKSLPDIVLNHEGEHLLTSPKPVYDQIRNYGLVDMEGYVLAHIARRSKKSIQLLKVVSDHCNQNSHGNIKQRISALSDVLHQFITQFIK